MSRVPDVQWIVDRWKRYLPKAMSIQISAVFESIIGMHFYFFVYNFEFLNAIYETREAMKRIAWQWKIILECWISPISFVLKEDSMLDDDRSRIRNKYLYWSAYMRL